MFSTNNPPPTARTFAVNSNNDIFIDVMGNLSISTNINAVLQACAQAAKTLLGEMVLNTTVGIPYFQTVWDGVPNLQQFDAALRTAFLAVPQVVEVISLTFSRAANPNDSGKQTELTYSAIILTTFGQGVING